MNFQNLYQLKAASKCKHIIYQRTLENRKELIKGKARDLFDFIFFRTSSDERVLIAKDVFNEKLNLRLKTFLGIFGLYALGLYDAIESDISVHPGQLLDYYELGTSKLERKMDGGLIQGELELIQLGLIPREFIFKCQRICASEKFRELFNYDDMSLFFSERGMELKLEDFESVLAEILEETLRIRMIFIYKDSLRGKYEKKWH